MSENVNLQVSSNAELSRGELTKYLYHLWETEKHLDCLKQVHSQLEYEEQWKAVPEPTYETEYEYEYEADISIEKKIGHATDSLFIFIIYTSIFVGASLGIATHNLLIGLVAWIFSLYWFCRGTFNRAEKDKEIEETRIKNLKQEIQEKKDGIKRRNQEKKANYERRIQYTKNKCQMAHREKIKVQEEIEKTEEIRKKLYSTGILHKNYQYNMVAVSMFYQYLDSGICSRLTGQDGAYRTYEIDSRMDRINTNLEAIRRSLSEIKSIAVCPLRWNM